MDRSLAPIYSSLTVALSKSVGTPILPFLLTNMRIGEQECCHELNTESPSFEDTKAVGSITLNLMFGDYDANDDITSEWSTTEAMDFAVVATSGASAADLSKVR